MDLKEIKRLISMVEDANISHFSIEEDGVKIEVKKEYSAPQATSVLLPQSASLPVQAQTQVPVAQPAAEEPASPEVLGTVVTSQMVGTFYTSPNPESPAFVKVGDRVEKGQVLCIIEAMKLFNEIESEISGVVEKVSLPNATPVEFGQELFVIREG